MLFDENISPVTVAICDDESLVVDNLADIVKKLLSTKCPSFRIIKTSNAMDLLKNISEIDLVFLDVEMPEHDGFEVGKILNEKNPECKIIIATGNRDRFKEAFRIKTLRYITKPFDKNEVDEAINAFMSLWSSEKKIEVFFNRVPYLIREKDVLYFCAMDSYSEAVTKERRFRTENSLSSLTGMLNDISFCRINKQYIVNLAAVEHYGGDSVIINGKSFGISRRNRKAFEEKYLNYQMLYKW